MSDAAGVREIVVRLQALRQLSARAAQENPNDVKALFGAGAGYRLSGDHENALIQFKRAAALQPNNHFILFELAIVQEALGQTGDAAETYARIIRIAPDYFKAWYGLVSLQRQTRDRNHIPALEAAFKGRDDDGWRTLHLGHALAKTHEDFGETDTSFSWLGRAKKRRREIHPYHPGPRERATDAAIKLSLSLPPAAQGHPSTEPIFVCGMPRTGTTLVDRILSSHPDVSSAGEIGHFFMLLAAMSGQRGKPLLDPEVLPATAVVDFAALGQNYVNSTRPLTGERRRFIDKAPSNYLVAGTILKALPEARIICMQRHPLDTVLSNYKQIFPIDDRYYDYAYDIGSAAHQYLQFDRMVRHLKEILPPDRFKVVNYESLVNNQEEETRSLLAFCNLTWDPRCLDFHKNAAGVATPSAQQVRQAMYTTSAGRWEKYGALLDPARAVLERGGVL
jgi:tetratricopeptide (TPR) repeat protein